MYVCFCMKRHWLQATLPKASAHVRLWGIGCRPGNLLFRSLLLLQQCSEHFRALKPELPTCESTEYTPTHTCRDSGSNVRLSLLLVLLQAASFTIPGWPNIAWLRQDPSCVVPIRESLIRSCDYKAFPEQRQHALLEGYLDASFLQATQTSSVTMHYSLWDCLPLMDPRKIDSWQCLATGTAHCVFGRQRSSQQQHVQKI